MHFLIQTLDVLKSTFYFLAILSVLVIVHEWGHYIVAKFCKMHVEDFSLFFGKVLWRLGERGGTVYNIRAIPLGGFVKIAGMDPDDISNGAPIFQRSASGKIKLLRGLNNESFENVNFDKVSERVQKVAENAVEDGQMTANGRADVQDLLKSTGINEDEHRYLEALVSASLQTQVVQHPDGYNQKPLGQRAAVIFAGPFMSIVFGYFLFCMMGVTTGFPDDLDTPSVINVVKGGAADKAGIKDGDHVLRINGVETPTWESLRNQIQPRAKEALTLTVERGGQTLDIKATPTEEADGETGKQVGRLGVAPADRVITWRKYSPIAAIRKGTETLHDNLTGIYKAVTSKHIKENIGGPIAIASVVHETGKQGLRGLMYTGATLSVSLGVMNLLPIPILDGGHLLLLGIEFVRRRRLTSRETQTAQLIGISIIGLMFVLVMYNDITRFILHR